MISRCENLSMTPDHCEALQEITNIGMGRAAFALSRILGTYVKLSMPNIQPVVPDELPGLMTKLIDINSDITAINQAFFGHWHGEAIVAYNEHGCSELAELMGYPQDLNNDSEAELFLDVSNVLVGACLNGIADILSIQLSYSAPAMLAKSIAVKDIFAGTHFQWSQSLLLEVNFGLEGRQFKSHLVIMFAEESLQTLCDDIDQFIAQL